MWKYDIIVMRQSQHLQSCLHSKFGEVVTVCEIQTLRPLVNQRLGTAVEDIFRLFETTIPEYEDEIKRQRRLLEVVERPVRQVNKPLLMI